MLVFQVVLCCLYKKGIGNSVSLGLWVLTWYCVTLLCYYILSFSVTLRSIVWLLFYFYFLFFLINLLVIELASIDSSPTRTLWDQPGFSIVAAIWLSKCYFCPCFFVAPIGPPSRWSSCCSLGPQTGRSSPFCLFIFWSSILIVIEFYGVIV